MRRSCVSLHALALLGGILSCGPASADTTAPEVRPLAVAIEDFSYIDTSGEPTDQTAVHQKRLQAFMTALRGDVGADQRVQLVAPSAGAPPAGPGQAASQGAAGILIVGGIQKMSTLVQLAKVAVSDVGANRLVFERRYTFRGDNDEAWDRARNFIARDIRAVLAASLPASSAGAATPLAVFDFELEDTSAAASAAIGSSSDAAYLADVTNGVRALLAQSGRYRVIDVSGASADAVKTHTLRDCGGCEAGIALKLGADKSLIGVVRRVSRTEYTVGFQIRDARTGAVVSREDSGLRMGTDDAWRRGAVRLIGDRLLDGRSQQ